MISRKLVAGLAALALAACSSASVPPANNGEGGGGAGGGGSGGSGGDGGSGGAGGSGGSTGVARIDATDPSHGLVGQRVVFRGANFETDLAKIRAYFGAQESAVLSVGEDGTTLETAVPVGATTGVVSILSDEVRVEGPVFTVDEGNPAPRINSLSPERIAPTGTDLSVTISGSGFVAGSHVTLNGEAWTSTTRSPTSIQFVVPASMTYRPASFEVVVTNDPPGGGASDPRTLYLYQDFGLGAAVDLGARKLLLGFTQAPSADLATEASRYQVAKMGGGAVPVSSVQVDPEDARRVILQLGQTLSRDTDYSVRVDDSIPGQFGGEMKWSDYAEFRSRDSVAHETTFLGGGPGCGAKTFSRPGGMTRLPLSEDLDKNFVLVVETTGHQVETSGFIGTTLSGFIGWDGSDLVTHANGAAAVGCPGDVGSSEPGALSAPRGKPVALQLGSIFVVGDTGNGRLQTYEKGQYGPWAFGSVIASGLDQPVLLGAVGVELWVANPSDQVERFALDGTHLGTFGSSGSGAGEFSFGIAGGLTPSMATTDQGTVYIADPNNNRVQKWQDGTAVSWLGGGVDGFGAASPCCDAGSQSGFLDHPRGVAVDVAGHLFVVDMAGGGRLLKFDTDGHKLWELALGYEPNGVSIDWDGLLRISDVTADTLHVYRL